MGSSNGISRGQLRPHFGGRSPPFLVAALCVGLGILGVSYYSLSTQYTALELQLSATLQRKDSMEKGQQLAQSQLHLKEEEFDKTRLTLEKDVQEIVDLNAQLNKKGEEITHLVLKLKSSEDALKLKSSKLEEEIKKNEILEQNIATNGDKILKLESELKQLDEQNKQLQTKLSDSPKADDTQALPADQQAAEKTAETDLKLGKSEDVINGNGEDEAATSDKKAVPETNVASAQSVAKVPQDEKLAAVMPEPTVDAAVPRQEGLVEIDNEIANEPRFKAAQSEGLHENAPDDSN